MIGRIRNALLLGRRRKDVELEFEAAYIEVRRLRPKKAFRQRAWMHETDALDAVLRWLLRANTVDEVKTKSVAIQEIVARCKGQVETEARVAVFIDAAAKKAEVLRLSAAALHGSAFRLAEHRHHAIRDECNHARRARDQRDEDSSLRRIEEKLTIFEESLARAEQVISAMPMIEARLGAIKPEEVWLDTGAKETYDDLLATFAETQKDVKRGDYDKAAQRLREIETLEAHLRDRSSRRADWALAEVAMWLTSPSVAEAFPQLAGFPTSAISPADIENLYDLRPQIERFVAARAVNQRERNVPSRDVASGRKLAISHPLRMPLDDCSDPAELEEFLRCVTVFGRSQTQ